MSAMLGGSRFRLCFWLGEILNSPWLFTSTPVLKLPARAPLPLMFECFAYPPSDLRWAQLYKKRYLIHRYHFYVTCVFLCAQPAPSSASWWAPRSAIGTATGDSTSSSRASVTRRCSATPATTACCLRGYDALWGRVYSVWHMPDNSAKVARYVSRDGDTLDQIRTLRTQANHELTFVL